jgi:hypothetical protein
MEHAPEISLRQAAAAFGPCAGGTDNAWRIITDRLKDDDLFWRQIVCDAILWDSVLSEKFNLVQKLQHLTQSWNGICIRCADHGHRFLMLLLGQRQHGTNVVDSSSG